MKQAYPSQFSLFALAAQWRGLVLMLVLAARRISAGQKQASPAAYAQAQMLELWSRTALGALTQQLCLLEEGAPPDTPEDAAALAQLKTIAVCLMALAMLAQKWMDELRALSGQVGYSGLIGNFACRRATAIRARLCEPGYLDSS